MSTINDQPKKVHEGRNVKRFREMMGIKQEALALSLGEDWSQKKVSVLESKEKIEDHLLAEIAKILNVPEEAIRNFDEETAVYNIQNNYEGANAGTGSLGQYNSCTVSFADKVFELLEDIKKLHGEKEALYERLLKAQNEK